MLTCQVCYEIKRSKSWKPGFNVVGEVFLSACPHQTHTGTPRQIAKSLGVSKSSYKSAKQRTLKSIMEHSQNSNRNKSINAGKKQIILDLIIATVS